MLEAAEPWQVFTAAGYTVELASTAGGEPPADGVDLADSVQRAFLDDAEMSAKLANTPRFADVDPADYDAVLFAGGHGTMWDLPADAGIARLARDIYENDGVVAACATDPPPWSGSRCLTAARSSKQAGVRLHQRRGAGSGAA